MIAAAVLVVVSSASIKLVDPVTGDDCSHVNLYYGERRPYYVYQSIIRVAVESPPPYEDKLRLYACSIGADAVVFVHRVGLEVSGIALRKWSRLKEFNLVRGDHMDTPKVKCFEKDCILDADHLFNPTIRMHRDKRSRSFGSELDGRFFAMMKYAKLFNMELVRKI